MRDSLEERPSVFDQNADAASLPRRRLSAPLLLVGGVIALSVRAGLFEGSGGSSATHLNFLPVHPTSTVSRGVDALNVQQRVNFLNFPLATMFNLLNSLFMMLNTCSSITTSKSKVRLQAAVREYAVGRLTLADISAKYGISQSTISNRARLLGLPKRERGRWRAAEPSQRQKDVLAMVQHHTYAAVGEHFGLSKQRVAQIVSRWSDHNNPAKHAQAEYEIVDKSYVISFRLGGKERSLLKKALKTARFRNLRSPNDVARALVYDFIDATDRKLDDGLVVTV